MHTTDAKLKPKLNEYRCKQWLLEKYVPVYIMNNALKTIKIPFNLLILNSFYFYNYSQNALKSFRVEWKSKTSSTSDTIVTKITSFGTTKSAYYQNKQIKFTFKPKIILPI